MNPFSLQGQVAQVQLTARQQLETQQTQQNACENQRKSLEEQGKNCEARARSIEAALAAKGEERQKALQSSCLTVSAHCCRRWHAAG